MEDDKVIIVGVPEDCAVCSSIIVIFKIRQRKGVNIPQSPPDARAA